MTYARQPPRAGQGRLYVSGSDGFVGKHLVKMLEADSKSKWTLVLPDEPFDLVDADATERAIASITPDAVIHLAAQAAVPESRRDPAATFRVNLFGTLNLLSALRRSGFSGRMLYVGTGDVYGLVPESDLPVAETHLPRPRNPYAVSKLAAEALCWEWHVSHGFDVVLARPFNHIGAGQSDQFAISDFARQIAEIRLGRKPPVVRVGDLAVTRDFTDVRDVVRAYFSLLDAGKAGEIYNVCSGVERTIGSMLDHLIQVAAIDVHIEQEVDRMRQSEQRRMRGDSAKIREATGWRPAIPLGESLKGILAHWEGRLEHG